MVFPLFLILKGLLKAYKLFISPFLGPRCRFFPSCSEYAYESLSFYGIFKGSSLTFKRLLKCHPWGGEGYDPVPHPSLKKSYKENFLENFNFRL
ncbi:MAG: membrane protein insertion efficiency factor YidD [Proteobacteria bacterium]|nr:membrane protein insertion efficiency factor YidD [Pseudomonadota bacterium]